MNSAEGGESLSKTDLLAFFAMVVGMFMAILDIQIVASSISVIGAGLSASGDELSWVQTSYLIAEVVIIPMSGFLSRLLSTRITYFAAASGFTVMSVFCSSAWNIESMIIFRALQGFFGGAMIPTVFGTIFIIFPPKKRPFVTIIIGLVVTIAPTVGPTLGGYITEWFSWRFMFLLNVIPGIFVCSTVFLYANFDKPNYSLLKNFDFLGIFSMVLSLGSLQYILEEGNKRGWTDDSFLLFLTIIVVAGLIFLVIRELTFENPVLDLKAFGNKGFAFGTLYSFILGAGLYGAVYILPLFLYRVSGYDTIQIGETMMVTGLAQFASAPLAGRLMSMGLDLRLMLAIGMFSFGLGCFADAFLTADSKFWEFLLPQAIRGASLMFCFIPINDVALGSIPKSEVQNASGLYNLTRNLGGAIGLAIINSFLISDSKIFASYIKENIRYTDPRAQNLLENFSYLLEGKVLFPEKASYLLLNGLIDKNAFVLAVNDIFFALGYIFFASIPFIVFIPPKKENGLEK